MSAFRMAFTVIQVVLVTRKKNQTGQLFCWFLGLSEWQMGCLSPMSTGQEVYQSQVFVVNTRKNNKETKSLAVCSCLISFRSISTVCPE